MTLLTDEEREYALATARGTVRTWDKNPEARKYMSPANVNVARALLAADAAVRGMREALEKIARQTLPEDMSVDQQLDADFEGACGLMIECARAAIEKATKP